MSGERGKSACLPYLACALRNDDVLLGSGVVLLFLEVSHLGGAKAAGENPDERSGFVISFQTANILSIAQRAR
jgi:hypothetical protein